MPGLAILPAAQPHPFAGQNAQAFMRILQTLGESETLRRRKMMSSDILGVLQQGGGIKDIAGVVQKHQQPTYSPGLQGLLQRIAAPFTQAPEAGVTDMLLKGTMESAFREPTLARERLKKYYETGDERFLIGQPTVQIGPRLLTDEQRRALAEKGFVEEMGLSTAETNKARQSVKTIIKEIPEEFLSTVVPGRFNMRRGPLIEGYKHYQVETNYKSLSATNREKLDDIWDSQIKLYNRAGYKKMGKGEFDWDPKDPRVQEFRKEQLEAAPERKEPTGLEGDIERKAENEIGQILSKMPEDVRRVIWEKIQRAIQAGITWQEILASGDLKPYRE